MFYWKTEAMVIHYRKDLVQYNMGDWVSQRPEHGQVVTRHFLLGRC